MSHFNNRNLNILLTRDKIEKAKLYELAHSLWWKIKKFDYTVEEYEALGFKHESDLVTLSREDLDEYKAWLNSASYELECIKSQIDDYIYECEDRIDDLEDEND